MNKWKKVSTEEVFRNKWLSLRVDDVITPDGKEGQYSVMDNTDEVVIVVPIDNDKNIYLIQLNRYPINQDSWELPKGRSEGEKPLIAARRELQEETGLEAKKITEIGCSYPLNGLCSEINHILIAEQLTETDNNEREEEGIRDVIKVPIQKALNMIKEGEITDGQTITALTKAIIFLDLKI